MIIATAAFDPGWGIRSVQTIEKESSEQISTQRLSRCKPGQIKISKSREEQNPDQDKYPEWIRHRITVRFCYH
jgi:hypothetical protein